MVCRHFGERGEAAGSPHELGGRRGADDGAEVGRDERHPGLDVGEDLLLDLVELVGDVAGLGHRLQLPGGQGVGAGRRRGRHRHHHDGGLAQVGLQHLVVLGVADVVAQLLGGQQVVKGLDNQSLKVGKPEKKNRVTAKIYN